MRGRFSNKGDMLTLNDNHKWGTKEIDLPEVDKNSAKIESSRDVLKRVCQNERHAHQELQRKI
jgi:hypothetical protein